MTERDCLIALNLSGDIGSIHLKALLDTFGSAGQALAAPQEILARLPGIGPKIAVRLRSLNRGSVERELDLAAKSGVRIITRLDPDYPLTLTYIPDPPIVLYLKGTLLKEDAMAIAIVGSRIASFYGLSMAGRFSQALCRSGFTVVSGLARGIDTSAHRAALEAGGRTIAVLGSGFNHIYPAENRGLFEAIAGQGAVVSEFAFDEQPLKQNFPRRNRLISGLSLGVLVVEAARNSGALITADMALEQGREVFALPGRAGSRTSFGTHRLIKQGCSLVDEPQDIIDALGLAVDCRRPDPGLGPSLSAAEETLYRKFNEEPLGLDEIVHDTGMQVPMVLPLLLALQLKKRIRQLPGKEFMKTPVTA